MPATSKKQQRLFGMVAAGKIARPKGMTDQQVEHFASTPRKGLPERAASSKAKRRRAIAAIRSAK